MSTYSYSTSKGDSVSSSKPAEKKESVSSPLQKIIGQLNELEKYGKQVEDAEKKLAAAKERYKEAEENLRRSATNISPDVKTMLESLLGYSNNDNSLGGKSR